MTDDLEQVKKVHGKYPNICLEYRYNNEIPSPFHLYVIDGKTVAKRNPEYVKYLKSIKPNITEKEISALMSKSYTERLQRWKEEEVERQITILIEEEQEEKTRTQEIDHREKIKK